MNAANTNVFVNCPFDSAYKSLFEALVFTITASGYRVRCALEENDSGAIRFEKICQLINDSGWSIHDLSRVQLDEKRRLPRFNMPFEFGLYLGAKRYGADGHKDKRSLVIGRKPHEVGIYLSDAAGSDHAFHRNSARGLISAVRRYLKRRPDGTPLPGLAHMSSEFRRFKRARPKIAAVLKINADELDPIDDYSDFMNVLAQFLAEA